MVTTNSLMSSISSLVSGVSCYHPWVKAKYLLYCQNELSNDNRYFQWSSAHWNEDISTPVTSTFDFHSFYLSSQNSLVFLNSLYCRYWGLVLIKCKCCTFYIIWSQKRLAAGSYSDCMQYMCPSTHAVGLHSIQW